MFMHSHAYVPSIFICLDISVACYFSDCLSLFLSFSSFYVSCVMAPKRKSTSSRNPLRSRASSSFSPSNPTPSHVRFCDEKAKLDFFENFSQRGIHLEHQVVLLDFSDTNLPIVIYSWVWESLCDALVTCSSIIIQEFYSNMHRFDYSIPQFSTRVWGIHMVVTLDIVSKVLHVPKVAHLDYPGCQRLRTVLKDELLSLFCETPSSWGNRQNTSCSTFAKGPRILYMVMTFIPHPLSHYNNITEPCARFLLSLIEDISINFPSHFILSLIDVYKDMATCDKLIFPSVITRLLRHFSVSYPGFPHFSYMCAIDAATVKRSLAQLHSRQPHTQTAAPLVSITPSTSAPSSAGGVVRTYVIHLLGTYVTILCN